MNLCINVSKDYLILQCFSDDEFAPGNWYSRNIVISKDKQKTSMRFEQLHTRDRKQIESINQLHRKRDRFALVIHPESNTILQNGVRTEGGALGEKISLAHGAALCGGNHAGEWRQRSFAVRRESGFLLCIGSDGERRKDLCGCCTLCGEVPTGIDRRRGTFVDQ